MRYRGGKHRLAKQILNIVLEKRQRDQTYIEPFVGGANVIQHVEGPRVGYDSNNHTISALLAIRDFPKGLPKNKEEYTEDMYNSARDKYRKNIPISIRDSWALIACSFGGVIATSYAKSKIDRDYVSEAYRSAQKQSLKLQGCKLSTRDYKEIDIPRNSLIYCDPPYKDTGKYSKCIFDHEEFYQWCRKMKVKGHKIFISEYIMPEDFILVWEKKIKVSWNGSSNNSKSVGRIERLYTI